MIRDNKPRRVIRHILLFILAVLSIFLSWLIWSNPARYGTRSVANEKVQSNQIKHDMSDVIVPTQIIYTNAKSKQKLVNSSKRSLSKAMVKQLAHWDMRSVTHVSHGNKERFLDYATMSQSIMLKYPNNITTRVFNEVYNQNLKTSVEISQIVFNTAKKNEFFILNDKTYDVYQVKITKQNNKKIRSLTKNNSQSYTVKEMILNHNLINDYQESPKVPYNSFLINKESSSIFIFTANLLDNTSAESIDTKKVKDGTVYVTDDNSKRILVKDDGSATFDDSSRDRGANSLNSNLEKGFYQMKQLGVQVDNMRYFNINLAKKQATFREYVSGFPIFNKDGLGEIKVTREANHLSTSFSTYNLEVPVPTNEGTKKLDNTQEVLNQLGYNGINRKNIEDIDIGYTWSGKVSGNQAIQLEPTWFIKYQGQWKFYQDLVS